MAQHEWVKYTETPIEVLMDERGKPIAIDSITIGEDDRIKEHFGCKNCHEPLETHYEEPCKVS